MTIAKVRNRMKHGEGLEQMADGEESRAHSTAHTHSHRVSHTSTKCSTIVPSLQCLSDSTNEKRGEGITA